MNKINIVVGFDQVEAIAYHVFCQSVMQHTTIPVTFLPLAVNSLEGYKETHEDGSNEFVYSRFLTPYLMNYSGWAIFADGDMVCLQDLRELWNLRDETKAVMVVKHQYETKASKKYLGNKNENYPRKNWSSLVLWNCSHPDNRVLTPKFIQDKPGSYLHRFAWLGDDLIGELPKEWNWLVSEYQDNYEVKLLHYTLGTPCFREYSIGPMADVWRRYLTASREGLLDY